MSKPHCNEANYRAKKRDDETERRLKQLEEELMEIKENNNKSERITEENPYIYLKYQLNKSNEMNKTLQNERDKYRIEYEKLKKLNENQTNNALELLKQAHWIVNGSSYSEETLNKIAGIIEALRKIYSNEPHAKIPVWDHRAEHEKKIGLMKESLKQMKNSMLELEKIDQAEIVNLRKENEGLKLQTKNLQADLTAALVNP